MSKSRKNPPRVKLHGATNSNVTISEHEKKKNTVEQAENLHGSEKWSTVVKRKTVGKNCANKSLKSIAVVHKVNLHVTRLHAMTTKHELMEYSESVGFKVPDCEELNARYGTYKSFKLTIDSSDPEMYAKVFDENSWPEGILVRRFVISKHDQKKQ